jgi:hypothetical protein
LIRDERGVSSWEIFQFDVMFMTSYTNICTIYEPYQCPIFKKLFVQNVEFKKKNKDKINTKIGGSLRDSWFRSIHHCKIRIQ